MYIIPAIESRIDKNKPTVLGINGSSVTRLKPSVYTVSEVLPILYGYTIDLASVFRTPTSSLRVIRVYNNTDAVSMTVGSSLAVLGINVYMRRLNSVTAVVGAINTTITITFVVFTILNDLQSDISSYINRGCVLEEVNITGHIATFSSMAGICALDPSILTKTSLPVPAALRFTLSVMLENLKPYNVYDLSVNPNQVDYILYQGVEYSRSRSSNPVSRTFTTRPGGSLLWI